MLYRSLYTLLIWLCAPVLLLLVFLPKKGKPNYGTRWRELFGWIKPSKQPTLWLHAASVGEVIAAQPIIQALKEKRPEHHILLTTATTTGACQAAKITDIEHRFAPLDYPFAIKGFLKRSQPVALLIMEKELWPNRIALCAKNNIPIILLNAHLSERASQRYQKQWRLFRPLIKAMSLILCQYPRDHQNFQKLSATAKQLKIVGSIKFDIQYPETIPQRGLDIRKQLDHHRPVWIAASAHQGEVSIILQALAIIREQIPNVLLILVPRHPQHFNDIAKQCQQFPFATTQRSKNEWPQQNTAIYLGDTMGELPQLYAAADVAFVGGSFVPAGGHNLLEAAALKKPCLIGPHHFNCKDIVNMLAEEKAATIVHDEHDLAQNVLSLLQNKQQRELSGQKAFEVYQNNQGALKRTIDAISKTLASS